MEDKSPLPYCDLCNDIIFPNSFNLKYGALKGESQNELYLTCLVEYWDLGDPC